MAMRSVLVQTTVYLDYRLRRSRRALRFLLPIFRRRLGFAIINSFPTRSTLSPEGRGVKNAKRQILLDGHAPCSPMISVRNHRHPAERL